MLKKSALSDFLRIWLPIAFLSTALCGLVYVALQQVLRTGADDPQIQMAEDTAAALSSGKTHSELFSGKQVELSTSLAPWIMIFEENGSLIFSTAILDGKIPEFPQGVFGYVREHGQDRITWQPREGVRQATVIERFQSDSAGGYVVAGRSLREVEKRIGLLLLITALAWAVSLVGLTSAIGFLTYYFSK